MARPDGSIPQDGNEADHWADASIWPVAMALVAAGVVAWLDKATSVDFNVSSIYIALLILLARSTPSTLWTIAALFLFLTFAGPMTKPPGSDGQGTIDLHHWTDRGIIAIAIVAVTVLLQQLMSARRQMQVSRVHLTSREQELASANQALELRDEAIFAQQSRYETVLRTMPFGVAIAGPALDDLKLNPAGLRLLGLDVPPDKPLVDWTMRWILQLDGHPLPAEQYPLVRAVRNGEVVEYMTCEVLLPNGTITPLLISAAPIRDRQGLVVGGVAAFADFTAQCKLQQTLEDQRRAAEFVSVQKTRFLSALSHDLRNPINAISLIAQLMMRTAQNAAPQETLENAVELNALASSLANLLSDVLDVSRIDSGRIQLKFSEFALADFLSDICRTLGVQAKEKQLEFGCHGPEITVRSDRIKLERAVTNLVNNAIKFTSVGSVKVVVEAMPDHTLKLSVIDTGIGIAEKHLREIFEDFVQLQNPERDRDKGTGLGLGICKRLVEAIGGTVGVESQLGHGSTFTITLPNAVVQPAM